MNTRTMLGLTAATLLAACSGRPASTAAPAPPVAAARPAPVVAAPAGTPLSVAAIPIGSPKFGATTDCNAMSGATAQGRTSATSMLDCMPTAQPVAAVQPVVAAPPPPPRLQTFTTYFDLDRADVTPEGRNIIEQAAANARAGNATLILVVGHTDTSGSPRYNDRLSVQRGEAVRQALIAAGVPAGEIEARGVGETDLAVPTPNGVREPRNRRVVIEPQRAGA